MLKFDKNGSPIKTSELIDCTPCDEGGYILTINGTEVGITVDTTEEIELLVDWMKYSLEDLMEIDWFVPGPLLHSARIFRPK